VDTRRPSLQRRRQRGTGSIKRVAEGKYQIVYDLPRATPSEPRRQRYLTIHGTKKDASTKLRALQDQIARGGFVDDDTLTVNELCDLYLTAKAISREITTVQWYRRHMAQHVRPRIGSMRVRDLRAVHIQSLLADARNQSRTKRRDLPLKATSLRNILVTVRAILGWGARHGYVLRNVAESVEPPGLEHSERTVISLEDVRTLFTAFEGTELEAVVPFAIGTGLRRSEICALTWSDLDLDEGSIRVQRAAANVEQEIVAADGTKVKKRGVIIKGTKTRKSTRTDYLAPFVVAVLRRHRTEQTRRHVRLGIFRLGEDRFVFDRRDGQQWDPNELSRQFSRLVQRKNLRAMRFHDLRHGYATLAFAAGVPLKVVSESLGHSSIGVTSSIYVHLLDQTKQDKATRLDAYLGSALGRLPEASLDG
jgi:integrase